MTKRETLTLPGQAKKPAARSRGNSPFPRGRQHKAPQLDPDDKKARKERALAYEEKLALESSGRIDYAPGIAGGIEHDPFERLDDWGQDL